MVKVHSKNQRNKIENNGRIKMNPIVRELAYSLISIKHRLHNKDLIIQYGAKASFKTVFHGCNKLCCYSYFSGELGFASYIGANSVVVGNIGSYCSISERVTFITKTHPVNTFVSSHPCFYSIKKQSGFTYVNKQLFDEEPCLGDKSYSIEVGNDVYIGFGVTIIGPCRIGDGAVIAAGAVITGNVPPYAIVGGVPAKIIKYRFSKEDIDFLERLQWWNKSQQWIKEYAKYFSSVGKLRDALNNGQEG